LKRRSRSSKHAQRAKTPATAEAVPVPSKRVAWLNPKTLRIVTSALIVGACAVLVFRRGQDAHPIPAPAADAKPFASARLPAECNMEVALSMGKLLTQPAFASQQAAPMVLTSVLSRTQSAASIVEKMLTLTESGSASDFKVFRACRGRASTTFVAAVFGKIRLGALAELHAKEPGKWVSSVVGGVPVVSATGKGTLMYAQGQDGSLIVSNSALLFEQALAASQDGRSQSGPSDADLGVYVAMSVEGSNLAAQTSSPIGSYHARRLEITADLERRTLNARLEMDSAAAASPMANQVRGLVAAMIAKGPDRKTAGDADPLVYLAQRSKVGASSNVVTLDSELSGNTVEWLAGALATKMRAQAGPT
jgi:hypothetical protein